MDKSCIVARFVELAGVDCHNSGQALEAEEAIAIKLLQYLDNLISATDQNAATSSTSGHLCEQYLQSDSGSDDDNDLHTDQDDAPNLQSSDDSDFEIDQKLQVGGVLRSLEDLQKVADYVKAHPTPQRQAALARPSRDQNPVWRAIPAPRVIQARSVQSSLGFINCRNTNHITAASEDVWREKPKHHQSANNNHDSDQCFHKNPKPSRSSRVILCL